jgi:hypothetical protein
VNEYKDKAFLPPPLAIFSYFFILIRKIRQTNWEWSSSKSRLDQGSLRLKALSRLEKNLEIESNKCSNLERRIIKEILKNI